MTFKQGSWEVKISSPVIPKQVWMLVCNEVPVLSGVRVRKRTHAHNPPLCLHCLGEADSWKECMRGLNCRGFLWYRRWVIGPPQICSYLSQFQSFIHHHYGHYCVSLRALAGKKASSDTVCETLRLWGQLWYLHPCFLFLGIKIGETWMKHEHNR